MKKYTSLYIFILALFSVLHAAAQTNNYYDRQWKKVDSLNKKDLPKSALQEVKKIYAAAKKENKQAQRIKALVYMVNLQEENREDNTLLAIDEIEKEITTAPEPVSSILQSYLAGLYWSYFQQHRFQLYGRTNTTLFNKKDIATWTIEDFHQKIASLYIQSLQPDALLKQTSLTPYGPIIIKGNVRDLRPTLYDLLAHRALEYFKTDERDINKPAYAFELSDPQLFAPAPTFIQLKLQTADSLSLQHKALLIYQDLIRFHLKDTQPGALLDVTAERLEFVYATAIMPEKDSLYVQALTHIMQQYGSSPFTNEVAFLLAAYYDKKAAQYNPLQDTTNRYDRVKAKEILQRIVKDSTVKNAGWVKSFNLLQQINDRTFSFTIEKVNVPEQPILSLVQYKNTTGLYFRLFKADTNIKALLKEYYYDQFWNNVTALAPVHSWQQSLPATNDLQSHAVEIKMDALPIGEYILVAADQPDFKVGAATLGAQLFTVSNISYVHQNNQFFVLHRVTGQPLYHADVQVYEQVYDRKAKGYINYQFASYQTDKNGYFAVNPQKGKASTDYQLAIHYGDDHLFLDDRFNVYLSSGDVPEEDTATHIYFFTDRSIYRPGQTVYFKGLVVNSYKRKATIATGFNTVIYLADANQEKVDSMAVTTNEFGSFSGTFHLPQQVLNGMFTITDDAYENAVHFSVEEYKRPKFYVDFNKVKQTYKVTDTIKVTGQAAAYAGNVIDGAQVTYRVVREPRFLYPWLSRRWYWPPSTKMEITHGTTTTGKDGKFDIAFTAIPDKAIDPKLDPVFDYHLYADITDINGETRSGEYTVSAGYTALVLKTVIDERMPVDSFYHMAIRTENRNGEYQPSQVNVSISSLVPEDRLIRDRYWLQPDQFVMDKATFLRYFPHDEYKDESDFRNWPTGNTVFRRSDSTHVDSTFLLPHTFEAGYYKVEVIATDAAGETVKDIQYVELYNTENKQLSKPVYLWTAGPRPIEPGEKTTITVGSAATDVFVVQQVNKEITSVSSHQDFTFTQLTNEKRSFAFTATEADRGGFGVTYFFIKDNRFYQYTTTVPIPWTNKELHIEYATFRDKITPGSKENWSIKLTGPHQEQVAAEMLASMYDASLDQFKMHQWKKPDLWPTYDGNNSWNGFQNFSSVNSLAKADPQLFLTYEKIYDQFDFDLYDNLVLASIALRREKAAIQMNGMQREATFAEAKDASLQEVIVTNRPPATPGGALHPQDISIRKNLQETAFFYPDLKTDAAGTISFSFTAPEALTRWKLQTIAHTKDVAFGIASKEIVTQKELMVQPNAPRFLRQGDHMELSTKIVNLSGKELTGQAELQLINTSTGQPVDGWFQNVFPNQYFTVAAGQSEVVKFPIEVPYLYTDALTWRIIARAGDFSDGEENALPVLTNKVLVTETLPLPMNGSGTKHFTFNKLLNATSETLQHQSLTVEYTTNPAWYAVQALPYIMTSVYDCAEQIWNRYYAHSLAATIVRSTPRIKQIFDRWKTADTAALLSNLQKNEELKSALLAETPWVMQAKREEEQKKNIALLFDALQLKTELQSNLQKLIALQKPDGSFAWFKGGPDDRYITQYIVSGMGQLRMLQKETAGTEPMLDDLLQKAILYLDNMIRQDYDLLLKNKVDLSKNNIGYLQVQYLYLRSFFTNIPVPNAAQRAYQYYRQQAQKAWPDFNPYMKGMIALALHHTGDAQTPKVIIRSLKETAIVNDELGMYWKNVQYGYSPLWWYAPIETQSLLITAFHEISHDPATIASLKTWLLKNKQTNNWRTTKATADACYALLLTGANWLDADPRVAVQLGHTTLSATTEKRESGTGYFKHTIDGAFVKPEMGNITVSVQPTFAKDSVTTPSWGAVYWQYFEDMDKVTPAATPLQLSKKLFVEKNSDRGPVLSPVEEGNPLQVGDKLTVRIELRVDRDLDYVHMKDMRASAFEPINVLSGYRWQGGLGYYQSICDASTDFFFNTIHKGTYVFEYSMFVSHAGNFSNGITTIQCMYAPEFSAHSEGVRITAE